MLSLIFKSVGSILVLCGGLLTAGYLNAKLRLVIKEADLCIAFIKFVKLLSVGNYKLPSRKKLSKQIKQKSIDTFIKNPAFLVTFNNLQRKFTRKQGKITIHSSMMTKRYQ